MREALRQLDWDDPWTMIPDLNVMKQRGLKWTPALEINGHILYEGENPTVSEMIDLLKEAKAREKGENL